MIHFDVWSNHSDACKDCFDMQCPPYYCQRRGCFEWTLECFDIQNNFLIHRINWFVCPTYVLSYYIVILSNKTILQSSRKIKNCFMLWQPKQMFLDKRIGFIHQITVIVKAVLNNKMSFLIYKTILLLDRIIWCPS